MRANGEHVFIKNLAMVVLALGSSLTLAAKQGPRIVYNGSESAPIGIYSIDHSRPNLGDLVMVRPWPELAILLANHDILPPGIPLLKTVAAAADDNVCRVGRAINVNGAFAAKILDSDTKGRPLYGWNNCRKLVPGEFFLLQPHPRSFDSRYFGPVLSSNVIGVARSI